MSLFHVKKLKCDLDFLKYEMELGMGNGDLCWTESICLPEGLSAAAKIRPRTVCPTRSVPVTQSEYLRPFFTAATEMSQEQPCEHSQEKASIAQS